ncbi:MAG TPA: hypothetical protein VM029_04695 [Opitutaceae bacterium]|nr:hypothetical protein [Opitutaceae bacterium]
MKKILLALSLLANAALGVLLATRSPESGSPGASSSSVSTTPAARSAAAATANAVDRETWMKLTAGDMAAVRERLKADGYPPSLQRAILAALIAEKFAARHQAIADMINAQPWWRGNLYGSAVGAKVITARQAVQREEKEMLDQLLGADSGATAYSRAKQARQNGDLTPEKASELSRILSDYNELMQEVRNAAGNILLPEDRAQLALLEKERRADIAKLLSADELFEYDLRSSPTAGQLRMTLSAFNPTDDEYRAIFRVQFPFDSRYGSPELMSAEQMRARRAEQGDLVNQIRSVLTPERFAEYQQKTDNAYIQANALVTRLQLPATATADIVAVQKDIMKRANEVRTDTTMTATQRTQQFQALASEAVVRLTPTLGDSGVAAYRQSGGAWINQLQRPPAPPSPAPAPKS